MLPPPFPRSCITAARLAAITPAAPLTPHELVSDDMLRQLARTGPDRALGEISTEDQQILAMYLPDICGELIARRASMRIGNGQPPFPNPRNHGELIENARAGFFSPPADGVPA